MTAASPAIEPETGANAPTAPASGDTSEVEEQGYESIQFVSFRVDQSEYGIDIMAIREIKGWSEVTALPNTPDYVCGVLNLRGTIVPILDLRCRFGHGNTEPTPVHVMIIVAVGDRTMGLLVDAVSDILTVTRADILPVPSLDDRSEQRFLTGLLTVQERMVALLDIEKLFDLGVIADSLQKAEVDP